MKFIEEVRINAEDITSGTLLLMLTYIDVHDKQSDQISKLAETVYKILLENRKHRIELVPTENVNRRLQKISLEIRRKKSSMANRITQSYQTYQTAVLMKIWRLM